MRSNAIESSKAGPAGPAFSLERAPRLSQQTAIAALLTPAIEAGGFEVVRIRLTGGATPTLQVMAERPDKTMSAEDCASVSRLISPILDEADPIAGGYALEVSSPGLDRPLTRLKDFSDWEGYEAKIELDRLVEGRKRFRGVLGGVEGENIVLDIAGEEEAALMPFAWIAEAKLVVTDDLIKESLRAAKIAAAEKVDQYEYDGDQQ